MIKSSTPSHAVLSQRSRKHCQNLFHAHPPAFYQARQHLHVDQHQRIIPIQAPDLSSRLRRSSFFLPFAVLDFLLDLAAIPTVVLNAALRGTKLVVRLFAAKRTTEILASSVARVCYKKYSAMPAPT
jgi:hypothetical protein